MNNFQIHYMEDSTSLSVSSRSTLQLSPFTKQKSRYLPEYLLLDFLLNTNFTIDLKMFHHFYGSNPQTLVYSASGNVL